METVTPRQRDPGLRLTPGQISRPGVWDRPERKSGLGWWRTHKVMEKLERRRGEAAVIACSITNLVRQS